MAAKKTRPPKSIDRDEMATILSYGDIHSDKAAAAEFNVTQRSIQRWRAAIREGRDNNLSALVALKKGAAIERCADLLTETYEAALRRLAEVMPTANIDEATKATSMLGELHVTRKMLLGGEEGTKKNEEGVGHGRTYQTDAGGQAGHSGATH